MSGVGKCFLVTGPPGVGKTTLIMRIYESLKLSNPNLKLQGFYSQEIRQGGERVGFEVVTLNGRSGRLACTVIPSREAHQWPSVGKYKVDVSSFESVVLPELKIREDTDLFIIDEVGKMELYSSSFFPAILNILQSHIPLLATVPIPTFGKDVPGGFIFRPKKYGAVQVAIWPVLTLGVPGMLGCQKKQASIEYGAQLQAKPDLGNAHVFCTLWSQYQLPNSRERRPKPPQTLTDFTIFPTKNTRPSAIPATFSTNSLWSQPLLAPVIKAKMERQRLIHLI